MPFIKSIKHRKILNSHVEFTTEFIIELSDGSIGIGSSPRGETISIYEDKKITITPDSVIEILKQDGLLGKDINQEILDEYLLDRIPAIGRNNAFSLSLAFFNASTGGKLQYESLNKSKIPLSPPRLCLNILNGGTYAYTNPVLSDFSEYMLVAKTNNIEQVIGQHSEIQKAIKKELNQLSRINIAGNLVHRFEVNDNRKVIEFLIKIIENLGLDKKYDLMIDASAGDLWVDQHYNLALTNSGQLSSSEMVDYWLSLIKDYNLKFLEDPFYEKDYQAWQQLTSATDSCFIIGDNLYSSNDERIKQGIKSKLSHGVVIKPNQAGTITAVRRAIETAQSSGQVVITSHRSISTEETFVSLLSCAYNVDYIKIGPLLTDYSSVMRLNQITRLTG